MYAESVTYRIRLLGKRLLVVEVGPVNLVSPRDFTATILCVKFFPDNSCTQLYNLVLKVFGYIVCSEDSKGSQTGDNSGHG